MFLLQNYQADTVYAKERCWYVGHDW